MLKSLMGFALEIEGRIYHIMCPHDAPTIHCKEFVFQFLKYIGQIEDNAKKLEEEAKANNQSLQTETAEVESQEGVPNA